MASEDQIIKLALEATGAEGVEKQAAAIAALTAELEKLNAERKVAAAYNAASGNDALGGALAAMDAEAAALQARLDTLKGSIAGVGAASTVAAEEQEILAKSLGNSFVALEKVQLAGLKYQDVLQTTAATTANRAAAEEAATAATQRKVKADTAAAKATLDSIFAKEAAVAASRAKATAEEAEARAAIELAAANAAHEASAIKGARAVQQFANAFRSFESGRVAGSIAGVAKGFGSIAGAAGAGALALAGWVAILSVIGSIVFTLYKKWEDISRLLSNTKPIEGQRNITVALGNELKKVEEEIGKIVEHQKISAGEQARLNALTEQQVILERQVKEAKESQSDIEKSKAMKTPEQEAEEKKTAEEAQQLFGGQHEELARGIMQAQGESPEMKRLKESLAKQRKEMEAAPVHDSPAVITGRLELTPEHAQLQALRKKLSDEADARVAKVMVKGDEEERARLEVLAKAKPELFPEGAGARLESISPAARKGVEKEDVALEDKERRRETRQFLKHQENELAAKAADRADKEEEGEREGQEKERKLDQEKLEAQWHDFQEGQKIQQDAFDAALKDSKAADHGIVAAKGEIAQAHRQVAAQVTQEGTGATGAPAAGGGAGAGAGGAVGPAAATGGQAEGQAEAAPTWEEEFANLPTKMRVPVERVPVERSGRRRRPPHPDIDELTGKPKPIPVGPTGNVSPSFLRAQRIRERKAAKKAKGLQSAFAELRKRGPKRTMPKPILPRGGSISPTERGELAIPADEAERQRILNLGKRKPVSPEEEARIANLGKGDTPEEKAEDEARRRHEASVRRPPRLKPAADRAAQAEAPVAFNPAAVADPMQAAVGLLEKNLDGWAKLTTTGGQVLARVEKLEALSATLTRENQRLSRAAGVSTRSPLSGVLS